LYFDLLRPYGAPIDLDNAGLVAAGANRLAGWADAIFGLSPEKLFHNSVFK
jgi:hypothetical protein